MSLRKDSIMLPANYEKIKTRLQNYAARNALNFLDDSMTEPTEYPAILLTDGDIDSANGSTPMLLQAHDRGFVFLFFAKGEKEWSEAEALTREHVQGVLLALGASKNQILRAKFGHDCINGTWCSSAKISIEILTALSPMRVGR